MLGFFPTGDNFGGGLNIEMIVGRDIPPAVYGLEILTEAANPVVECFGYMQRVV